MACALRREGYAVFGLIRDEKKSVSLLKNEIIPVIGDASNPEIFQDSLESYAVVVDAVGLLDGKLFNALVIAQQTRNPNQVSWLKPLFVFTAGVLDYGPTNQIVDSTCIERSYLERVQYEGVITSNDKVRSVIIRPGFVYGGHGGFFGSHLFDVKEDEIVLVGNPDKRWNWVHVDDLADAFVKVVNAGHIVDGEIFDIVGSSTPPTYSELRIVAAKIAGWNGTIKYIEAEGWWVKCDFTCLVNGQKSFNLLGWREKHLGIITEMELFYRTYKACKDI